MGKILQFKAKPKNNNKVDNFLEQLEMARVLFLQGDLDKIIIIATGEDLNCCASNGIRTLEAKEICRDFIYDSAKYTD